MATSVLMRLQAVDRARMNLSGDSGAILLVNQVLDKHNFLLAWRNEYEGIYESDPGLDPPAVAGEEDHGGPGGAPGGVGEELRPGVGPHYRASVQVVCPQLTQNIKMSESRHQDTRHQKT